MDITLIVDDLAEGEGFEPPKTLQP